MLVLSVHGSYKQSTFCYNAVKEWDQINENIKSRKTLQQYGFRKENKSFLNRLQAQKETQN